MDTPYTIPTPVKDDDTFIGWYDNSSGNGTALTVLPVGYDGTVYAIWDVMDDVTTSVDAVDIALQGKMYDLLGRPVDENYKGVVVTKGQKFMLK